jgi:hypothetical protein
MTARQQVEFLAGSRHRVAVAERLREGAARPCELEGCVDASRATVQRALSALTDRGWARRDAGEYRLTAAGALVLRARDDFGETIETVDAVSEPLSLLGPVDEELPTAAIREATVTVADPKAPHAPIGRYLEILGEANVDRLRGLCPIFSTLFEAAHEPLVDERIPIEVVVDEATYETARDRQTMTVAVADRDSFDLYVHPDSLNFGLSLFDGRAVVGAYDDHGRFRACLDATADPLVEWVRSEYRRHRERSRLVGAP